MKTKHKGKNKMENHQKKYKAGDNVWVLLNWIDDEFWVLGTVIKTTAKRVKVLTHHGISDSECYFHPQNVKFKN